MPEAPEVKIFGSHLQSFLLHKPILECQILGGRFSKENILNLDLFNKSLLNDTQITQVGVKGKFLYIEFNNQWFLWNTLGMTGQWSSTQEPHSAFVIKTSAGNAYFTDPRRFGTLKFVKGRPLLIQKLAELGPNLLDDNISKQVNYKIFDTNKTIVEILMNQKNIAGIGNYIKSEALYISKISPWRTGRSLSPEDRVKIVEAAHTVASASFLLGGSTLATYKNFEGNVGSFNKQLKVYKKNMVDGMKVISQDTLDKRTTYWVPEIQT